MGTELSVSLKQRPRQERWRRKHGITLWLRDELQREFLRASPQRVVATPVNSTASSTSTKPPRTPPTPRSSPPQPTPATTSTPGRRLQDHTQLRNAIDLKLFDSK